MNSVSFQLNGKQWTLTESEIEDAIKNLVPEPPRAHIVEVSGKSFPVKQVFSAATGLDRLDFTTNQARTVFKRLGLVVARIDESK
jgi:hypothetical protein